MFVDPPTYLTSSLHGLCVSITASPNFLDPFIDCAGHIQTFIWEFTVRKQKSKYSKSRISEWLNWIEKTLLFVFCCMCTFVYVYASETLLNFTCYKELYCIFVEGEKQTEKQTHRESN